MVAVTCSNDLIASTFPVTNFNTIYSLKKFRLIISICISSSIKSLNMYLKKTTIIIIFLKMLLSMKILSNNQIIANFKYGKYICLVATKYYGDVPDWFSHNSY